MTFNHGVRSSILRWITKSRTLQKVFGFSFNEVIFMRKIKLIALLTAVIISAFAVTACKEEKQEENKMKDTVIAEIVMENGGVIKLELYHNIAPVTVENFVKLANENFYDGVIFHRVIPGFMIQGGDPEGTGYGGPGYTIKGEFSVNGVENNISHVRGVISMARTSTGYDTAGSQFFICHGDSKFLDGEYAAFGRVTEGMDVVDAIAAVETGYADRPVVEQKIKTINIIDC